MSFENNIVSIYGKWGKAWLDSLPDEVQKLEAEWGLNALKPMDNLSYNYVLSGYQENMPIILKLNPDPISLSKEAHALEAFAGHGAVELLEQQKNALLLQRAVPGHPLKKHPQAIEIACSIIEKLHKAPIPQGHHFPSIEDWLSDLDNDWDLPTEYLNKARALRDHLMHARMPSVLLHGDLHQDNILSNGQEWLVIDPKGVIGSPIHEVWACIENPDYDIKYIAEYFHYPLDKVVQWYFVHLILAACWQVEDNLDPSRFLKLAEPFL